MVSAVPEAVVERRQCDFLRNLTFEKKHTVAYVCI